MRGYFARVSDYYADNLSGERLRRCYEIAPPRVRRYLEAEIAEVRRHLAPGLAALELGCGTGRVLGALAGSGARLAGLDNALPSLRLAARDFGRNLRWVLGDAHSLPFGSGVFDRVFCVQNGPSAIGGADRLLVEALRVCAPGGRVLFASYLDAFWPHRLDWFRRQAAEGLLGEIDESASGDGVIVCRDGLRLGRLSRGDYLALPAPVEPVFRELDGSSLLAEWRLAPTPSA